MAVDHWGFPIYTALERKQMEAKEAARELLGYGQGVDNVVASLEFMLREKPEITVRETIEILKGNGEWVT